MSGRFFLSGTTPLYEGEPQPLSTFTFSLAGTSTAQDAYTDAANLVATSNPYTLDANGYAGDIFLSRARYRVVWKSAAGTTLKTWDPVDKDQVFTRGAGLPSDPHPGQKHANTSDGHTYEYKLATSAWLDLGASDAVGNTATVTEQLTGTSTSVYCTPDSVAGLWQRGADIASASTISLPASGGYHFNITGTTGITAISSAQGGRTVKLKFASSLTITHNGTSLILPGGVSITTRAGDIAEFTNEAAADASGSNWRLTDYLRNLDPIETPSSAKTTNYTVAATDRNGLIRFSGASSDSTLTLPAVSGLAGFKVTFVNLDGPTYGVTVDANGSETIDGATTRKTFGTDPVTLFCDGTAWYTISGSYVYCSGNQTITAAGALALAHGLGSRPNDIWGEIECTTINASYAVGDRVVVAFPDSDGTRSGCAVYADATNVNVRFGSSANLWSIPDKSSGNATSITNSSWRLRVYARS